MTHKTFVIRRLVLVLFFPILLASGIVRAQEPEPAPHRAVLRAGTPVEGSVPAELSLELGAGDFIALVVEQGRVDGEGGLDFEVGQGVDLVLSLTDPSRHEVQARDSLWGIDRPERLAWVAESPGIHRLSIAGKPGGAFRALFELRRPATGEDRRLAEADELIAEAERVFLAADYPGVEATFHRATESLHDSTHPWARERRLYALQSLYRLAPIMAKQDPQLAEVYCRTSSELASTLGESAEAASALNQLGILQLHRNALADSVVSFQDSLRLRRLSWPSDHQATDGGSADDARTLTNLGAALGKLGDVRAALRHLDRADALWQIRGGGEADEAATHNSYGVLYRELGQYEKAEHHYRQALVINRRLSQQPPTKQDLGRIARTLGNLGWVYLMQDEPAKAREHYEEAVDRAGRAGDATAEAGALNGLGRLEVEEGRTDQAEDLIRRAIVLRRASQDLGGQAGAQQTQGDLRIAQQRWVEADKALAEAYRVAELGGRHHLMASIDIRRARAAAAQGDLDMALDLGRRSLEGIDALRDGMVEPLPRARFVAARRHYYEIHLAHLMTAYRASGRSELLAELFEVAERSHARSLYEALREQQLGFSDGGGSELAEQERAIQKELAELDLRYRQILDQRRWKKPNAPGPEAVVALESKIDNRRLELSHVQSRLRDQDPALAAFRGLAPISLESARREQLVGDELVLHLTLGDEKSLLLAIDRQRVELFELPPRQQLEPIARSWLDDLTARARGVGFLAKREADARARDTARTLSELLLAPVAHRLRGQPLVVVPDGIFHALPFEALPLPGAPAAEEEGWFSRTLLDGHELSVQPSLSAVAALREAWNRQPTHGNGIAVWADPVFDRGDERLDERLDSQGPQASTGDGELAPSTERGPVQPHAAIRGTQRRGFERLPATARVVKVLRRWRPTTRSFVGFDATTSSLAGVGEYGVLHFATHGQVDEERPELSGLALSRFDREGSELDDDLLSATEIEALDLHADLVLLGACETALGQALRGEGLLSLTRAFLHAGARRVIASRWPVDDAVTAELTEAFYGFLLGEGLSPTAALRRAQLEIARRHGVPFYWSAFMLQGEWR